MRINVIDMLIIVESPAKAKTISKIVGKEYTVKASVGHIRKISDDKKTKDGRPLEINGIDIDNQFSAIFEVDPKKKEVVSELKKLAKTEKEILFATDFDREGEAISWHLSEVLGIKDKTTIKRLEFHEITAKAINEALANPKPLRMHLVEAQKARQVLDKLVGYKVSPLLWRSMGKNNLSAGRVQSPALKLLVDREKEILAFVPEEFWLVKGIFGSNVDNLVINNSTEIELKDNENTLLENGIYLQLNKYKGEKLDKLSNYDVVKNLLDDITLVREYVISSMTTKNMTTKPKAPFTTSTLQQAASSKLGYVPKITMSLAQKLYEGVDIDGHPTALITYMRTDSVNLSEDALRDIRDLITSDYTQALTPSIIKYSSKAKNAQEAHEAIRPTNVKLKPEQVRAKLSPELFKLYDLIWRQTIACQMKEEKRQSLTVELQNKNQVLFSGSVSWTVEPGYKVLFPELISRKPENIDFAEGQKLNLNTLNMFQKFTQPPSRFSQASLIKELEELGIGRPSTYATIISTLIDREYVEKGSSMKPTLLGMKIAELLDKFLPNLTSATLTANLENKLDEIANGKENYLHTLEFFWEPLKAKVEEEMKHTGEIRKEFTTFKTDEKCPECGSSMELKLGRFGDYFQCEKTIEHKFPKNYREYNAALDAARIQYASQTEGKKCEECGEQLIVRVSKSTLNPYIACPKYTVGNKHSILPVNFGPCPECAQNGRQGVLVKRKGFRGSSFIGCSLDKETCGYIEKKTEKKA
ncbi:MAG: type I DNA topoisomerase [Patescibacteria group bacterium]